SRRRHTRSDRDWSSDVCSSDLFEQFRFYRGRMDRRESLAVYFGDTGWRCCTRHNETYLKTMDLDFLRNDLLTFLSASPAGRRWRSEERRVGKERCAGWRPSLEG